MPKRKSTKRIIQKIVLGAIPFLAVLAFWTVYVAAHLGKRWLIPTPAVTAVSFWHLVKDGTIPSLLLSSSLNLLPPFIAATIGAVLCGVAMGVNRTVHKIFYPFLSAIYPVPSLAWLPFVILLLGFTRPAIWAVIFVSCFMKVIYNVISGVENINVHYILAAKNLGFSQTKIIVHIVLPSITPQIMTGLRIGFGSAWRSLIGAEMLVVTLGGLGKFIWVSQWYFQYANVIAGIIVISIVSVLIEIVVFRRLERATLMKWGLIREAIQL